MKKFSELFEKKRSEITEFDRASIKKLLKEHDELDIIVRGGQRYFIAPYMHDGGEMEHQGENFQAMTKDGDKIEVKYSDIVGVEF
jgi:hypothetical protein